MGHSYNDFFTQAQKNKGLRANSNPSSVTTSKNIKRSQRSNPSKPHGASKEKVKSKNYGLILFLIFGFVVTLSGGLYLEEISKFFSSVDISLFTQALAEESAKPSSPSSENNVKDDKSKKQNETDAKANVTDGTSSDELELNHLARLRERKVELDKREEEIAKQEEELVKQRLEVEDKLKELEGVRRNISSILENKVQGDDQKVQDLVQFYSNMKPPQAAKILETLDESLAVRVIEKMKKKNAAEIMNLLKPEKAQSISEKYAGYKK